MSIARSGFVDLANSLPIAAEIYGQWTSQNMMVSKGIAAVKEDKPVKGAALDYGEQDENGVDLSLIRMNLRLTPAERLRRGDRTVTPFFPRLHDHPRFEEIMEDVKRKCHADAT